MCIFISKNVEKLKAEKDVKRLIKLVEKSKDRALSKKAIHALGDLKDPQAVPVLIAILNYDPIQHLGNKSVSMIVDNRVGELLQIKSAINELRTAAAEALGEIGDKRAVFSLRKISTDPLATFGQVIDGSASLKRAAERSLAAIEGKNQAKVETCHFCNEQIYERQDGLSVMFGGSPDFEETLRQAAKRKFVCPGCSAVFCLECGNKRGESLGTGSTHCPKCGTKVL